MNPHYKFIIKYNYFSANSSINIDSIIKINKCTFQIQKNSSKLTVKSYMTYMNIGLVRPLYLLY